MSEKNQRGRNASPKGFVTMPTTKPTPPTASPTLRLVNKSSNFVKTSNLPKTLVPKCIMLENYSGLHFWTTVEDGNYKKAVKRIERYVYNSDMVAASLYEKDADEIEKEIGSGMPRTFVHII